MSTTLTQAKIAERSAVADDAVVEIHNGGLLSKKKKENQGNVRLTW